MNGSVRSKTTLATIYYFEECWKAMEIIFLSSWAVLLKIVCMEANNNRDALPCTLG